MYGSNSLRRIKWFFVCTCGIAICCRCFLVDSVNYKKMNSGQKFKYFGGHYTKTPVNITVKGTGRWYLIVRGGGQYKYRFY